MDFKIKIKYVSLRLFLYFFLLASAGAVLLQLPCCYNSGKAVPFIDSLFTTISAICVTGLSSVDMSIYTKTGFVFLMLLIESGGLGLVSFFTVFLVFSAKKISLLNKNIIRDYFTEESALESRQIIKFILKTTAFFQGLGAVILAVIFRFHGEKDWLFNAAFISVSAFCNAGFSPYSDSLARFTQIPSVCLVVSMLIITGSLGFTVFANLIMIISRKFSRNKNLDNTRKILSLHTKIVLLMTFTLLALGTVIFFFAEYNKAFAISGKSSLAQILHALNCAFFQSTTLRTAGFETIPQASFSPFSTFVSILLMITGGSPGSMAGGLKTTTIFLLISIAYKSSSDRNDVSVFKRDIAKETQEQAVSIFMKGICFLFVFYGLLLISESKALEQGIFSVSDLFFETVSAFGTVGLSKGITSSLSEPGKILTMLLMFAGRTGITFIALDSLHKTRTLDSIADFPKENILVG